MAEKVALLLEDQPLIAVDISQTLMDAGYFVHMFRSCAMADRWLSGDHPNILVAVMDVELSDGSCSRFARDLTKAGIPFVVHTGVFEHELDEPFRAGVFVPKPSPDYELRRAILQAAERLT